MTEKKTPSPEQRRNTLKKILAGTGAAGVVAAAPEKWARPVIDSVNLPAHAQTSQPLSFSDPNLNASLSPGMLETLVPSAHAGFAFDGYTLCILFNQDLQTYTATLWDNGEAFDLLRVENATVEVEENLGRPCFDVAVITYTIELGPYNPAGVSYTLRSNEPWTFESTASPMGCQLATCPPG